MPTKTIAKTKTTAGSSTWATRPSCVRSTNTPVSRDFENIA